MPLPHPPHARTSSLLSHPSDPTTLGMAGPSPTGILVDLNSVGLGAFGASVNLASPVDSAFSVPTSRRGASPDSPRTRSMRHATEGSVFGTSLQRSRKLAQTDYFGPRTPPLSSPSALSSTDSHTPASDLPLTPQTASTGAGGLPLQDWPVPPSRSRGLGFDIKGPGDDLIVPISRAGTPYYLAPEWSTDIDEGFPVGPLGMSLQSQSLVNLSRPTNLEQLRHLRRAAFELESVAFGKRDEAPDSQPAAYSRRIRRKAVPMMPTDEAEPIYKPTSTLVQHRLSVAQIPPPLDIDSSKPKLTSPPDAPKRPTLASIYRNSRASQSVSELSTRLSSLSTRGSSLFASKTAKPISAPIPIESETSSISEHSEISMATTSSSFSATFAKETAEFATTRNPSKPIRRHTPEAVLEEPVSEARSSTTSERDSSSSEEPVTPTTPPTEYLPLPVEVESGLKKLGVGFSRGMTSVFNLLGHSEGDKIQQRPKEQNSGHRKIASLSLFGRKTSPSPRRSFSLPKMFKRTPVA